MQWKLRLLNYRVETEMPLSMFEMESGEVVGTWVMGNDYRVKSCYYGGYPHGYLRRVRALFPEKKCALHLFSGMVDRDVFPGETLDVRPDLVPDYVMDAEAIPARMLRKYDVVLADPPYTAEDADHYGAPMVNRNKVIRCLAAGMRRGAHLIWLDQAMPMYRKDEWAIEARIGIVRSTNHRFRVMTVFRRR